MKRLRFYTTLGCHLCEQLEARLMPLLESDVQLERIEIAEDDRLIQRYGERIPVLQDEGGAEFAEGANAAKLVEWLEQCGLATGKSDLTTKEAPELMQATRRNGRRVLG